MLYIFGHHHATNGYRGTANQQIKIFNQQSQLTETPLLNTELLNAHPERYNFYSGKQTLDKFSILFGCSTTLSTIQEFNYRYFRYTTILPTNLFYF